MLRLTDEDEKEIQYAVAQLRHAYANLMKGAIKDSEQFANGLISPQIKRLEAILGKAR